MVEGARLEIVWARKRLGGSNPLASARNVKNIRDGYFLIFQKKLWTKIIKEFMIKVYTPKKGFIGQQKTQKEKNEKVF